MIKFLNFFILDSCMQYKQLVDTYEKLEATTKRLEKTDIISKLLKKTKWCICNKNYLNLDFLICLICLICI